jgi:hypothetical protein
VVANLQHLERVGRLDAAGVCMRKRVDPVFGMNPWGRLEMETRGIRGVHCVTLTTLSHLAGARLLRLLELDDVVDERARLALDARHVAHWPGFTHAAPGEGDVSGGTVNTPKLATNAASAIAHDTIGKGFSTTSTSVMDVTGAAVSLNVSSASAEVVLTATMSITVANSNSGGFTQACTAWVYIRRGSTTLKTVQLKTPTIAHLEPRVPVHAALRGQRRVGQHDLEDLGAMRERCRDRRRRRPRLLRVGAEALMHLTAVVGEPPVVQPLPIPPRQGPEE